MRENSSPSGFGERADKGRLSKARSAFEERVALGEKRGERAMDDFTLANEDLLHLGAEALVDVAKVLRLGLGRHAGTL